VKIVVDMNLPPSWVRTLADAGHEAAHWTAIGDPRASDVEILEWARQNDRLVLTHDLDFGAILAATGRDSPSVVQLRTQDVTPEAVGSVVVELLEQHFEDLKRGALLSLDETNNRIRTLPLREGPQAPLRD
jgi:predicted nuclease of predicted toxin-antitoxin system